RGGFVLAEDSAARARAGEGIFTGMNFLRHLTFVWTPWSLTASIVGVVITAGYCFLAWQHSGYRRSQGLLEGLRLVIVCLAALLFNQPEWVEEYRPEEKPTVAVL